MKGLQGSIHECKDLSLYSNKMNISLSNIVRWYYRPKVNISLILKSDRNSSLKEIEGGVLHPPPLIMLQLDSTFK